MAVCQRAPAVGSRGKPNYPAVWRCVPRSPRPDARYEPHFVIDGVGGLGGKRSSVETPRLGTKRTITSKSVTYIGQPGQ